MKHNKIVDQIRLQDNAVPKYLQLVNAVLALVDAGKIKKDEVLPSINQLSVGLGISRDTAEKAYRHLKEIKVVNAVSGKGYFITDATSRQKLRVLLLFDSLGAHKKTIYEAFVNALGNRATIDFHLFNKDYSQFKKLLTQHEKHYTHYVLIPCFIGGADGIIELMQSIPAGKLLLLDKLITGLKGEYDAVYENFEEDIYTALKQALDRLQRYKTLKLVFPKGSRWSVDLVKGFNRFCHEHQFTAKVVNNIEKEAVQEGDVFICLTENDLVILIQKLEIQHLKAGTQVGLISYNETPLKKVLLNGITTISANFEQMGIMAAKMILNNKHERLQVPFNLTLRQSL
ncbi:GntR family transcriptional regulator [Mucilaginibacter terrae]|uniref:GntR family transcriptional regulator n=1 Tax=Mucilaginibacter terrae TaxID=1955052 RepID=UPI003645194B